MKPYFWIQLVTLTVTCVLLLHAIFWTARYKQYWFVGLPVVAYFSMLLAYYVPAAYFSYNGIGMSTALGIPQLNEFVSSSLRLVGVVSMSAQLFITSTLLGVLKWAQNKKLK